MALTLLTAGTLACGYQGGSGSSNDTPSNGMNDRERLLATCPAKAPDSLAWQQSLAEKRGLNRPVWEDQGVLDPVGRVAERYLWTLPADQRGGVWIDNVRNKIVVQVTREAEGVLATLRKKVSRPNAVAVETVRWSGEELAAFADRIYKLDGANITGISGPNANGRVEVFVTRDVEGAHRRIAEVVDPCAFKVIKSAPMRPS